MVGNYASPAGRGSLDPPFDPADIADQLTADPKPQTVIQKRLKNCTEVRLAHISTQTIPIE
jgi:hypothetical protein